AAEHDDTHPLIVIRPFIDLQANERIGAHPFDLLPERGDPVQMLSVVREIDRNNVGLSTACARQSAEIRPLEGGSTFVLGHFVNQHSRLSWRECPARPARCWPPLYHIVPRRQLDARIASSTCTIAVSFIGAMTWPPLTPGISAYSFSRSMQIA